VVGANLFGLSERQKSKIEETSMRNAKLLWGLLLCCSGFAFGQMSSPLPAKTPGEALIAIISIGEHEFTGAADAMPEDKYSFAPTNGEFKGVRTFAQQIKHVAAVNYVFGASILGEKPPVEGGENGPDSVKSKAEILKFLKDSFAYLNKALASITDKNQLDQVTVFGEMKMSRLSVGAFSTAHPFDHYGQMVEYLRMNGIIPPASRQQNQ
jgi:uncharacterized damage-inducible protein DinB